MDKDFKYLWELNVEIGQAESVGHKDFLDKNLAPTLAFMRANQARDAVDRTTFLNGVQKSARRETEIESISLFGKERAIVTCIVTMEGKRYHNVRLFVRQPGQNWKLLGWANEPMV